VRGHYECRYRSLLAKLSSLQEDLERQASAANSALYVMDDDIEKPQLVLEAEAGKTKV